MLLLDAAEEEDLFSIFDFIEQSLAEAQAQLLFAGFGLIRILLRYFPQSVSIPDIPDELVQPYHREIARPDTWEAAIWGCCLHRIPEIPLRIVGPSMSPKGQAKTLSTPVWPWPWPVPCAVPRADTPCRVYNAKVDRVHNPKVAGSNPAPAIKKTLGKA